MKVALLSLEITSHSHFFTPKISSGSSIFMFCFTATWQARRQPAFASRLVICESSVGRISPPPSLIVTRHWPQEPPPPQAEETKIPLLDSVFSSLSPAGVRICLSASLLISITTSPAFTSFERAARISPDSTSTISVNITTPRIISILIRPYSCTPEKDIKPSAINPVVIKVIPNPRKPAGTLAYFIFSRIPAIATIASIQPMPEPKP